MKETENVYKTSSYFHKKKGLLEIRLNRHKGCQLCLTQNVLQDILPPESSKKTISLVFAKKYQ